MLHMYCKDCHFHKINDENKSKEKWPRQGFTLRRPRYERVQIHWKTAKIGVYFMKMSIFNAIFHIFSANLVLFDAYYTDFQEIMHIFGANLAKYNPEIALISDKIVHK